MGNKNTRIPPDNLTFKDLFHFTWERGLGNELTSDGIVVPWTAESLEAAFDDFGHEVDKRSIANWLSGQHKPTRKNTHVLAKIISAGNVDLQKQWTDALLKALKTKAENEGDTQDKRFKALQPQYLWQHYHQFIIGFGFGILPLLAVLFFNQSQARGHTIVRDLRLCDDAGFSKIALKCHKPASHFPSNVGRIFLSFEFENSFDGEPFEINWYQNSAHFHTKRSFNDGAWPGYTYFEHEKFKQDGEYAVRLVIDGKTTTKTFVIGMFDPANVHPDHDPD